MKEFLRRLEEVFAAVAFTEAGEMEKARQCLFGPIVPDEIVPGPRMPLVPEGDS